MKRITEHRHKLVTAYMFEYTDNFTNFSRADSDRRSLWRSRNPRTTYQRDKTERTIGKGEELLTYCKTISGTVYLHYSKSEVASLMEKHGVFTVFRFHLGMCNFVSDL